MNEVEYNEFAICEYCLTLFDKQYWSWCKFINPVDTTSTTMCSECAQEVLKNQSDCKTALH